MSGELIGEAILCILLALTTLWCILLTRRLGQLRVDRGDVAVFVEAVEAAASRAESATAGIRAAAAEAQAGLDRQRASIETRIAELGRLNEAATQSARRLEVMLHRTAKIVAEQQSLVEAGRASAAAERSRSDREPFARAAEAGMGQSEARASSWSAADLVKALEAMR